MYFDSTLSAVAADLYDGHKLTHWLSGNLPRDFLFMPLAKGLLVRSEQRLGRDPQPAPVTRDGEIHLFRLVATVTRSKNGRRFYLAADDLRGRAAWLERQLGGVADVRVGRIDAGLDQIEKPGQRPFTLDRTTFAGALVVKDSAQLNHRIQTGIGRAKAFGRGLLQLKPMETYQ